MITIIACTNRFDSNSRAIATHYSNALQSLTNDRVELLDLADIPMTSYTNDMYDVNALSDQLIGIQDEMIRPAEKFIFIVPEYNGGMPGVLKLFIDALSLRESNESFDMKKACLTGVSSGRAGNLRGMEHLTGVLNYLNVVVFPNRLPISGIEKLVDPTGNLIDPETISVIDGQLSRFLEF